MGMSPLNIKIVLESNLLKSTMLVGTLGVLDAPLAGRAAARAELVLGRRCVTRLEYNGCVYIYIYI